MPEKALTEAASLSMTCEAERPSISRPSPAAIWAVMAKSGRACAARRDGRIEALDAPFAGGERTIPFGVSLGRQDNIRQFGGFRQEEFLDDDGPGALERFRQAGIVASRVCCDNVDGLAFQGICQVRGRLETQFPGALVIGMRPDADQAVVRFASAAFDQSGTGRCQGGGTFQPQTVRTIQDDQIFGSS